MYATAAAASGRPIAGSCTLPYPQRFEAARAFVACSDMLGEGKGMRFGSVGLVPDTAAAITAMATNLPDDAKLMLYALGRQAIDGPCNEPAPSSWSIVEQAKYRAYQSVSKMDKMEAMRLYVKTLDEDAKAWWATCVKAYGEASAKPSVAAPAPVAEPDPAPTPAPAPAPAPIATTPAQPETLPRPTSFAKFVADLRQRDVVVVLAASGNAAEASSPPRTRKEAIAQPAWTSEHVAALAAAQRRAQFGVHVVELAVGRHDRMLCDAFSVGKDASFWRRERAADDALAAAASAEARVLGTLRTVATHNRRGSWTTLRLPPSLAAPLLPGLATFDRLVVKHVLNVISTCAHVLVGKVFGNRMVDVRVANEKLFARAVGIVRAVLSEGGGAAVSDESAELLLLRAIHGADNVADVPLTRGDVDAVQRHVAVAITCTAVVPTAIVLGLLVRGGAGDASVAEARRIVAEKRGVYGAVNRVVTGE